MSSSSRIMRSPVAVPDRSVKKEEKSAGKTKPSEKPKPSSQTEKTGFESHSGRDLLLGEKAVSSKPTKGRKRTLERGQQKKAQTTQRKSSETKKKASSLSRKSHQNTVSSPKKNASQQPQKQASTSGSISTKKQPTVLSLQTGATKVLSEGKMVGQEKQGGSLVVGTGQLSDVQDSLLGEGILPKKSMEQKQSQLLKSLLLRGAKDSSTTKEMVSNRKGSASAYQMGKEGRSLSSEPKAFSSPQSSRGKEVTSSLSLRSLQFLSAKSTDKKTKLQADTVEDTNDSPRQEFRALLRKWAGVKELAILQQAHVVTPLDASFVAKQIAVLAQTGQLPVSALLSTIQKLLKRPGNRKKLSKLKSLLVKKGVVSASISMEALELIAAMIALYLAKGGNATAEELVVDLFQSASKHLELPDGGGSHHEEGREEDRHERHQKGEFATDIDGSRSSS